MKSVPAIRVSGVTKRFGSLQALGGVDLEIQQGEFFGLLGHNGAGKTTLISSLAGLSRPDGGTLEIMGHDVQRDYRAARLALGVVPQELVFDPFFSVREMLRIQSGYFGIRNNDDWIDELLHHLRTFNRATGGHQPGSRRRRRSWHARLLGGSSGRRGVRLGWQSHLATTRDEIGLVPLRRAFGRLPTACIGN